MSPTADLFTRDAGQPSSYFHPGSLVEQRNVHCACTDNSPLLMGIYIHLMSRRFVVFSAKLPPPKKNLQKKLPAFPLAQICRFKYLQMWVLLAIRYMMTGN